MGDIDGDGDIDVLITNGNGTVRLFRNDAAKKGRWLSVRTFDPVLRRDAIGAIVRVRTGARTQVREIWHTYGYLSSSDASAYFGLGAVDRVDEIRVRWPDGAVELFGPYQPDRTVELVKGAGRRAP